MQERFLDIRQMGIDPESVTYSMVMDRITELESEKGGLDQEYAKKAKDFKEMEKQMGVMKEYMDKQGIKTRKVARSEKKKDGQERKISLIYRDIQRYYAITRCRPAANRAWGRHHFCLLFCL